MGGMGEISPSEPPEGTNPANISISLTESKL